MEQRAAISPALPCRNPTVSYWQDPPDPIADLRSTPDLPPVADVVIIGSGISGACIAYNHLRRRPDVSVLLLEARQACSGATGRNGGHTKGASYRTFDDNATKLGEEEAFKIARLEYDCMRSVHAFARLHDIDCDSTELDTVDIMFDEGQMQQAKTSVARMRQVMGKDDPAASYQFWDARETQERFLTPDALGAVSYPAGSISAYKFVIGVLRLAVKSGLNVHTNTPVTSISKDSNNGKWLTDTPRGRICATQVVLATNGYTAALWPQLRGVIVPLRGHVTAQRPGSSMPKVGLPTTYSFIYHNGYEYMIPRPPGSRFAGDLVIGGGLVKAQDEGLSEFGTTDDGSTDATTMAYLQGACVDYFKSNWGVDNPEGRIRKVWSGIMGFSADGFPLVGSIPEQNGLFISASFQGHGMVLCFSCANALVQMMLGPHEGEQELDLWFPQAYKVSERRLALSFQELHLSAQPAESQTGRKEARL